MSKLDHQEKQNTITLYKTNPSISENLLQTLSTSSYDLNTLEQPRQWVADIPLGNGESINTSHFLQHIKEFSSKAVNLLPVSGAIKKKILQEIGVEPFDKHKIREIYKLWRQRISQTNRTNLNVYGECQPKYKDGKFSFIIAMENNAPKKLFLHFLYHEIDHMVWYLGYQFAMNELGCNEEQIIDGLMGEVREMKTEFFARVNTANQAMVWAEDRDFVFGVWTWQVTSKQDIYSQSKNYASQYVGARNRLYNLLLKKYGTNTNAKHKYAAIQEPWFSKFNQLCTSFAKYLFFIDSLEWFKDFIDRMSSITASSTNIEQAIDRLCGRTGEMKIKWNNIEFVKKIRDQHQVVLINCK